MQFMLSVTNLLLLHSSIAMEAKLCAVFVVPLREVREVEDTVGVMQPKRKLGCQPSPSYLHSFRGEKLISLLACLVNGPPWCPVQILACCDDYVLIGNFMSLYTCGVWHASTHTRSFGNCHRWVTGNWFSRPLERKASQSVFLFLVEVEMRGLLQTSALGRNSLSYLLGLQTVLP